MIDTDHPNLCCVSAADVTSLIWTFLSAQTRLLAPNLTTVVDKRRQPSWKRPFA